MNKRTLYIIILFTLITSCTHKTNVEEYWRLNFGENVTNHFHPYELKFNHDSLIIVDGYNFKQTSNYINTNDSISIAFDNKIEKKYSFNVISDTLLYFNGKSYLRYSPQYFTKTKSYKLLGWNSTRRFIPEVNSVTIHLIKDKDSTKVILNDITSDLKSIVNFLKWGHGSQPVLYLYLGKGIELNDLIEIYCWIKYSRYSKVELVTANESFEKFYSIQDYIDIDDLIYTSFLNTYSLPHLPPIFPKSDDEIIDIFVHSESDLNTFIEQSDTSTYRYNFSKRLSIKEYLNLTRKLNSSGKKRVKRFVTI